MSFKASKKQAGGIMNRHSHIRGWLSVGTLAFTMAMLPGASRADETAADSAAQATPAEGGSSAQSTDEARKQPGQIEEITVTARKREESLQQTPVAISAFTATDLQDRDVRQLNEITASVPTLQFDQAVGSQSSARVYLRGVGNGDPLGSDDPGVGVYVDGVFLPRAQGALLTVSDVQQVEVLRGPQGTLFGKNTIGGAVSITTKKPDPSAFSADASVRIGNYKRFDTRLVTNIPVVPEVAAVRLSFATATRDGFTKNKSTGRDFSDDKLLGGRLQFLAQPSDNLELNFSADRSIENRSPAGGKCKVSNNLLTNGPGLLPGASNAFGTAGELQPGTLGFQNAGADLSQVNTNVLLIENTLRAQGRTLDTNGNDVLDFSEADVNGNGIIDAPASAKAFASTVGVPSQSVGVPPQFAVNLGMGGPAVNSALLRACAQDDARDERSVASDLTSLANNLETFGTNFTAVYDFEDGPTFKSISSFRRNELENRVDNDYTELNFAQASVNAGGDTQDAFSQEFQLTGSGFDNKFNWVAGVYAFAEDIRGTNFGGLSTTSQVDFGQNLNFADTPGGTATSLRVIERFTGTRADGSTFDGFRVNQAATMARLLAAQAALGGAAAAPINMTCAAAALGGVPCLTVGGAIQAGTLKVKNSGYAGYTQGTFDVTDALSLTVGARLTQESKRVRSRVVAVTAGFVGADIRRAGEIDFEFERTDRFKDISPLVNLSYQLSDDAMVYTTFSRGFKSGGFNGRANDPALTNGIADEKLISYELGFKSAFFDRRLTVNGATYFSKYQDIQLTIPQGLNGQASIAVLNAGQAEIKGGELEFVARVLPNLELSGSVGIINSDYTDFEDGNNLQAKERRLLATPNYTGNASALYTIPLGSLGDMRLRTEWTHRGASGTDVVESELLRKGKNGELDASVTFALADGKTEFVVFGNNLLNREYFTNGVNLGDSLGIAYRFFNDPRTYGIEIRRSF
jgi:outer membrane receptor protein involved in Fe transport